MHAMQFYVHHKCIKKLDLTKTFSKVPDATGLIILGCCVKVSKPLSYDKESDTPIDILMAICTFISDHGAIRVALALTIDSLTLHGILYMESS